MRVSELLHVGMYGEGKLSHSHRPVTNGSSPREIKLKSFHSRGRYPRSPIYVQKQWIRVTVFEAVFNDTLICNVAPSALISTGQKIVRTKLDRFLEYVDSYNSFLCLVFFLFFFLFFFFCLIYSYSFLRFAFLTASIFKLSKKSSDQKFSILRDIT